MSRPRAQSVREVSDEAVAPEFVDAACTRIRCPDVPAVEPRNDGPGARDCEDPIDRREFLRLVGALGATAVVGAGCEPAPVPGGAPSGTDPTSTGRVPRTAAFTAAPSVSSAPSASADLEALARTFGPRLLRPGDAGYPSAAALYSPRFDSIRPVAVARCASPDDVRRCLDFVRETGTPVTARGGGHSYGGYSTTSGLVIDVRPMNAIGRGTRPGTARVGAGARLADVYAELATLGTSIPAGSCPTVGITGLALGGGVGVVARKYGLTCDAISAVEVVTADGTLVRCDEHTEPDLYWAHRGGGGGNFGVVTALEFATHEARSLTHFLLRWDWSHASDVVSAWQRWLPTTPDGLWSSLHLDGAGSPSGSAQVYASGVYVGDAAGLQPLLDALHDAAHAPMTTRFVKEADYLQTMLIEGGCADLSRAQCRPAGEGGKLGRESNLARSDFITTPLTASGIDVVVGAIDTRRAKKLLGGSVLFDAYGGAINRLDATDTAFVHRDTLACLQYVAPAPMNAAPEVLRANQRWLDDVYTAMRPHVSGFAYQNYIDPSLADWKHAYYGANLDRLVRVKTHYDPGDVFRFAQSIPTAGVPTAGR